MFDEYTIRSPYVSSAPQEVYNGMVVGENARAGDLEVRNVSFWHVTRRRSRKTWVSSTYLNS